MEYRSVVLMYHFHYTKLLLGNQQGSLFNLKFPFSLDYVYRHASLINEALNENVHERHGQGNERIWKN